ncbi:MAG: 4,5-dihydroxyphthalate dehydrogenase [Gammaproteobacteria bacterium]|jgi:phthalate 4,5-cis-dihydrodiol dehydrogenase|nr:4,5-dihydroxyphthalate dehydrogenase [Gammaproteobacteria bacterium]|tara:strand:+ start:4262 stop:5434 length:1173 start_codon:yes stop_codon:yes gene_type:complete
MSEAAPIKPVKLGVVGLGRGFMLTLPALLDDDRVELAGAATGSQAKQQAFEQQFGYQAVGTTEELNADPDIEAVYIATPHEMHRDNVIEALAAGKHVLVEKPMTIRTSDAAAIVEAVAKYGKQVIVGPSHSFDKPIVEAGKLIASGRYGPVGMIHATYYTDFVFRPRRPEELDAAHGGGVVFNQGAHHADILQTLAGARPTSVYGCVGNLDARRPCDGAYSALLEFENGCIGSMTYSGYAHYDTDSELDWVGELGVAKTPEVYAAARQRLLQVEDEVEAKKNRGFGDGSSSGACPVFHEHFGKIVISCEKADLRPTAKGIHIYSDDGHEFLPMPLTGSPREEVVAELYAVVRHGVPPVHSARRGYINVALCEGIYESFLLRQRVDITPPW